MNDPIITVERLGKRYSLRHLRDQRYVALRDVLVEKATGLFRRNGGRSKIEDRRSKNAPPTSSSHLPSSTTSSREDFWALKDVSFEVKRGEVVGIIGRNGAGKSTLLKILSRITEPTEGRVKLRGRVASLLEVGTGFHPELTGRENIYLNGAILGMSRAEIRAKFDEIVAFAETEKFLDTPVKRYSSGMYVRLAFAVAAHLEPEILVIDEVLAVGDAEFQKKCLGKMGDVAREGRTVLFVSHNMAAVEAMCSVALLLVNGRLELTGSTTDVVGAYLQAAGETSCNRMWNDVDEAPGNEQVRIKLASIGPCEASPSRDITVRSELAIELQYWNLTPKRFMNVSLQLYNDREILVFSSVSLNDPNWRSINFSQGLYRSVCHIPGDFLNNGNYRVDVMFVRNESEIIAVIHNLLAFTVADSAELRGNYHGPWPGAVRPNLRWQTDVVEAG